MMYFLLEGIRHSFIRSDLFYSPFRLSNKHEYHGRFYIITNIFYLSFFYHLINREIRSIIHVCKCSIIGVILCIKITFKKLCFIEFRYYPTRKRQTYISHLFNVR